MLDICASVFCCYINIRPNRIYLDKCLIGLLCFQSSVDPLDNVEVVAYTFLSIKHSSAVDDVMQAQLNSLVEIVQCLAFLGISLDILSKYLDKGTLTTIA